MSANENAQESPHDHGRDEREKTRWKIWRVLWPEISLSAFGNKNIYKTYKGKPRVKLRNNNKNCKYKQNTRQDDKLGRLVGRQRERQS